MRIRSGDIKQLPLFDINLTSESIDIKLMSETERRVLSTWVVDDDQ